jgi:hypothetical protein
VQSSRDYGSKRPLRYLPGERITVTARLCPQNVTCSQVVTDQRHNIDDQMFFSGQRN